MVLIECFTDSHIDNLAACLALHPGELIFLGDTAEMSAHVKRYRRILKRRGLSTDISLYGTQGMDFAEICDTLNQIVCSGDTCVIDLTGGDELVIMAVGAVMAGLSAEQRRNVQIQKYDPVRDVLQNCISGRTEVSAHSVSLAVDELIELHGGILHSESTSAAQLYPCEEIDSLWQIVSENPREWNRSISVLNEFESRSGSKTEVYLPLWDLRDGISDFDEKECIVRELLDRFCRSGIIEDRSSYETLSYRYVSPLLRYCTLKAGNVLEVKTLMEAGNLREWGAHYFDDCRMSVSIDWDGIIHEQPKRIPETRNEIDVVLTRGVESLFISCKNGSIGEEELYKLHTVASRFGGAYARKMLIATDLDQKRTTSNRALRQRAWDMDIFLVTDAAELSKEEWRQVFIKAMN